MVAYEVAMILAGIAIFGAVVLPRVLSDAPMSFPILFVAFGMALFSLPTGIDQPHPFDAPVLVERLTELVVIVALMGAGLKLDRPFDVRSWSPTWRLLAVTMPLTILLIALLGWWFIGLLPATAMLLGAVLAPTDPVLASDVQATPPTEEADEDIAPDEQEDSIRFALTSEAGFNDGLAFPFTNLAIAMAAVAGVGTGSLGWLGDWILVDVFYKIGAGAVVGIIGGEVFARLIFRRPVQTELARVMRGGEALAATLVTYGVTELLHGYGFIAVFVAALALRHYEWDHAYYHALHDFAVMIERLLMAAVLVLFGGALAGGLLSPLAWTDVLVGIAIVFLVRPVAGIVGQLGAPDTWIERTVVAFFGIRGIGSFYYLAFALNESSFQEIELLVAAERLWAIVGFVVVLSIVVHGVTASPVMEAADRWRGK